MKGGQCPIPSTHCLHRDRLGAPSSSHSYILTILMCMYKYTSKPYSATLHCDAQKLSLLQVTDDTLIILHYTAHGCTDALRHGSPPLSFTGQLSYFYTLHTFILSYFYTLHIFILSYAAICCSSAQGSFFLSKIYVLHCCIFWT